jgi:ferritin-like metal-binding protein YciE
MIKAEKCDAMDGILVEATGLLEDFSGGAANDSTIIFSAQAVEHYEISRHGSMHAHAMQLGMKEAAGRLKGILDQEHAADKSLTALAEGQMNAKAA